MLFDERQNIIHRCKAIMMLWLGARNRKFRFDIVFRILASKQPHIQKIGTNESTKGLKTSIAAKMMCEIDFSFARPCRNPLSFCICASYTEAPAVGG
jgi:hypothetical protein